MADVTLPEIKSRLKAQLKPTTFKKGISVLLYSICRKEDVGWVCKKPLGKVKGYECIWGDKIVKSYPPKNRHLCYKKKIEFGGFRIQDLYNYEIEFPVTVKEPNGQCHERIDLIKLKVEHEPVCINFWHCEIFLYRVLGDGSNKTEKLSNSQIERAGNLMLDDLADMAYLPEETEPLILKRRIYKTRHRMLRIAGSPD